MKVYQGATLVGSLIAITILTITMISTLELQASIIKAKFFLQYDNTASLLASEGLEIVRAASIDTAFVDGLVDGTTYTYAVAVGADLILSPSLCTENDLVPDCALVLNEDAGRYILSTSASGTVLYRFVNIEKTGDKIEVTSTVVVKNPRFSSTTRKYVVGMNLFDL